jgi:pre-mRNA-splicing factor 38B
VQKFTPSPANFSKTITIGTFAREILLDQVRGCLKCFSAGLFLSLSFERRGFLFLFFPLLFLQYYFETIFPRIPKTVSDEVRDELRSMNLPTSALGNAGQGGPSRRGSDDGIRRPASVKASLAVAFGQRAPNRAGAREVGRGMGADLQLDRGRGGGGGGRRSRSPGRRDARGGGRNRRSRSRSRSRDRDRDRYGGGSGRARSRSRSRDRGGRDRDWDHRDRDDKYCRGGGGGGSYHDNRRYNDSRGGGGDRGGNDRSYGGGGGGRGSSRSPSPSRDRGGGSGRDARDVFRDRPAAAPGGNQIYRNNY